jgi:hypothetical protein
MSQFAARNSDSESREDSEADSDDMDVEEEEEEDDEEITLQDLILEFNIIKDALDSLHVSVAPAACPLVIVNQAKASLAVWNGTTYISVSLV